MEPRIISFLGGLHKTRTHIKDTYLKITDCKQFFSIYFYICFIDRAIFLVFAVCIFVFQMKQSLEKYMDPPILQRASTIKLQSIKQPR